MLFELEKHISLSKALISYLKIENTLILSRYDHMMPIIPTVK